MLQDQVDIVSVDVIMDTGTDSDHYLVIASIVFDIDGISRGRSRPVSFKKPVRELHLVNTDQMMLDITNAFYENDITQFVNVSCALDKYNTILQDTIDIHAPKIVKQYRHVRTVGGTTHVKRPVENVVGLKERFVRIALS